MKPTFNSRYAFSLFSSIAIILLTACGGGGGSSSPVPQLIQSADTVDGQIIVPQIPTAASGVVAKIRQNKTQAARTQAAEASACATVPPGYNPLANANLEARDEDNNVVQTFSTDACGAFSVALQASVAAVGAALTGYEPLSVSVAALANAALGSLVSMLPDNAEYEISSLQYLGNNRLAFSIVDSVSGRPVIGLPPNAVSVTVNTLDQPIQNISSVAATANSDASVVLVMDASGSMSTIVAPDLDRIDLASLAAHTFINGKGAADETGFVIFGSSFDRLTSDFLENTIPLQDPFGRPVSWEFSDSGFVSSSQALHRAADAYNFNSVLYRPSGVALHPESGDVLIN